jgi:hypothetical protein
MENTAKTPEPTEYSWQERALKAEAELAKWSAMGSPDTVKRS